MLVEPVEALLPEDAVALHPLGCFPEPVRLEPRRAPLGVPTPRDEPRTLEDLEVLRDRRKRHVEGLRQLSDRRLTRGEAREDRPPGRIGDGRERRAKPVGRHARTLPSGYITRWCSTPAPGSCQVGRGGCGEVRSAGAGTPGGART